MEYNGTKSGRSLAQQKQPPFDDEDLVLMLYCYQMHKKSGLSSSRPCIIDLSCLMQEILVLSQRVPLCEKLEYRKPDGVCINTRKYADCDPAAVTKGNLAASAGMRKTWNEYASIPQNRDEAIKGILNKYNLSKAQYPGLFVD